MKQLTASIAVAVAMLCALLGLLVPQADAQTAATITNTATAHWTFQGVDASASSNTVAFSTTIPPISISTFVQSPTQANAYAFSPSRCGDTTLAVPGINGNTAVASLEQSTKLYIGDAFYFRLVAPLANKDPTAIDSITTELVTSSGDRETITIYETGPNTGVFIGAVPTTAIPPSPVAGDCRLSVASGDQISIHCLVKDTVTPIAVATLDVLADPYGYVFDSEDGSAVDGAQVSIVDAATGAPAQVFALDGVTPWPSTVITGQPVTDGAGVTYPMNSGEYRFPLVRDGNVRLLVTPPQPYTAPSTVDPASLAGLKRLDGSPVQISAPSFGAAFAITTAAPVHIDIPIDRPPMAVSVVKSVSRATAQPGDLLGYTIAVHNVDATHAKRDVVVVDAPSPSLRLRADSVRIDGVAHPEAITLAPDGRSLTARLGNLAPGQTRTVTYAMTVRADAPAGQAVNKATATDSRGLNGYSSAVVRIEQDGLTARMTLIGRVTAGGCSTSAAHPGVPGVRVMLEDGSYAVTDADGRYHFDGVTPGDHVVQAMSATLVDGAEFAACHGSVRQAGSAISRFISGQGGSLAVADFHVKGWNPAPKPAPAKDGGAPGVASDREAAGGDTDWLALGNGPDAFLFPGPDHNPRAPALRVVIRHRATERVELSIDGKPVDKVSFDGLKVSADRTWAVSIWRGLPLERETSHLTAVIRNADGSEAGRLERDVHFNQTPAQVEIVREKTHLVADGRTRPVLALRVLDRNGRPVHAGISGEMTLGQPYESAEALDAMQSRALSGLGRAAPHWVVKGDDGIALVELAPTMVSGRLSLDFTFGDRDQQRHQSLEAWVVPGDLKWTLVGLAEAAVGSQNLADIMEKTGTFDSDLGKHARVAFYAKGRVLGSLLTAAYDSAKQKDDQPLLGAIDPRAYYTVYADGATRRFDAASREKYYIRIEAKKFSAMFGDYETGFTQTQLARYQRTLTGVQAEGRFGRVHVQAFGAKVSSTHRRVEIQGAGLSGPYALGTTTMLANSETVTLQVRDRFRSEVIVSSTTLSRFIDYDVDLLSGSLTFKHPVQSRDADLNPQFIVVEFDTDPALGSGGALNGGLRGDWTSADGKLRVGTTAITDTSGSTGGGTARTNVQAVDLRARPNAATEIRAEAAVSESGGVASTAWIVEAEHHDRKLDLLAYVHSVDQDFGTGSINGAESGRRKLGLTARYRVNEAFSISGSSWYDDSLTDATHREAVQVKGEYRTQATDVRLGVSTILDHLATGDANSTVIDAGITRHLLNNRLELEAATSFGIGQTQSVDLPARHSLTARYALTQTVKLVGTYEIASGDAISARTGRIGVELQPWHGARASAGFGKQDIAEYGARSYAAFGLAQTFDVSKAVSLDATLDANKVLGGFDLAKVVNAAQPVASGGQLNGNGQLAENYTAITLGGTWRRERWMMTARGEWRDGELARRKGLTLGAIRQLGEGRVLGAGLTVTDADGSDGSMSKTVTGALAYASRPGYSSFAYLTKLEYRADRVTAATATTAGTVGAAQTPGVAGTATSIFSASDINANSRRLIASFSGNWSPRGRIRNEDGEEELTQRTEISLFAALRHNFDKYDGYTLAGTTLLGGIEAHIGLGDRFEIGGSASIRTNIDDHATNFSVGPTIGFAPTRDVAFTLGYNVTGYRDRDFAAAQSTNKGVFATLKAKFDANSFSFLGLGR